ncbi:MAG TPA: CHAT domain-containing protein [Thermoanaerobaculia bacterium]|nr:CHAT domain-containing protein [Thermoanaerobaculia bacterium]
MSSPRTVLTIEKVFQGGGQVRLTEALAQHPLDGVEPLPLSVGPDDPQVQGFRSDLEGASLTRTVGQTLYTALVAHPELKAELRQALLSQGTILIDDQFSFAQSLPWEALFDDQVGFLALVDQVRLGRAVMKTGAPPVERRLDQSLRVLAVLAAAGGDTQATAEAEWKGLTQGLKAAKLPWRLQILGSDEVVKEKVEAAADPAVKFEFLASRESIRNAVESFKPHVLHFFCHGFNEPSPILELATRSDQELAKPRGSVALEEADFSELRQACPEVWLVVLNCCLGAAAGGQSQPLARLLVRQGYPAVVGMQEPIDRRDAHCFAAVFYEGLARYLRKAIKSPPPVPIDWPLLMVEPRKRLCRQHRPTLSQAHLTKPWTLPVLYVSREPFQLSEVNVKSQEPLEGASLEVQSQIEGLQLARAALAAQPGTEPLLADIDARIAELKQQHEEGGP